MTFKIYRYNSWYEVFQVVPWAYNGAIMLSGDVATIVGLIDKNPHSFKVR